MLVNWHNPFMMGFKLGMLILQSDYIKLCYLGPYSLLVSTMIMNLIVLVEVANNIFHILINSTFITKITKLYHGFLQ